MPILENKVTFQLRESCVESIGHRLRKMVRINSILGNLRSSIIRALTRSNVTLFSRIGIISLLVVANFCSAALVDYSSLNSPEEVIARETDQILQIPPNDYEALSEAYIARGESYLFCENYEMAFLDLARGYELAALCRHDVSIPLAFRSLFGLALSYENTNRAEEAYTTVMMIREVLDAAKCSKNDVLFVPCAHHSPIQGPDRIPMIECIERAQNTAIAAKFLIHRASGSVQFTLNLLIDDLESRAIQCCRAGGLWKACLQPVVNKWHLWNEKWKIFGLPPDPAWD